MSNAPWLDKAKSYIGVKESSDLPEILGWIKEEDGNTRREPWCADFVGHCLRSAGFKDSGSPAAISYAKWGKDVSKDKPIGAIVVFKWQDGSHHVSIYNGAGTFCGGNQGTAHEVSIEPLPLGRAIAWRWPV